MGEGDLDLPWGGLLYQNFGVGGLGGMGGLCFLWRESFANIVMVGAYELA